MIKIITDGASDISQETAKELGIRVIPIKVNFSGGILATLLKFYGKLTAFAQLAFNRDVPTRFTAYLSNHRKP